MIEKCIALPTTFKWTSKKALKSNSAEYENIKIMSMKIIFAGTPPFAATALSALLAAGHDVRLVLSQPDRPSGRGMRLTPSPVKALAVQNGIEVRTPKTLSYKKDAQEAQAMHELLQSVEADVMVVAAYGMLLPESVLNIPKGIGPSQSVKCINIHASLLPRWRGAAPITRAIEAGDTSFGVTLMKMDVGLDTGPMLAQESFELNGKETTSTLTETVAKLGAEMLVRLLANPTAITIREQPQEGITYARKVTKLEGQINFHLPCHVVERRIRAFTPFPSSFAEHNGTVIKIWEAQSLPELKGIPGEVLAVSKNGIDIACAEGAVRATVLQRPGKPKMAAQSFLQGYPVTRGEYFK